jgi:hypothetical protein
MVVDARILPVEVQTELRRCRLIPDIDFAHGSDASRLVVRELQRRHPR